MQYIVCYICISRYTEKPRLRAKRKITDYPTGAKTNGRPLVNQILPMSAMQQSAIIIIIRSWIARVYFYYIIGTDLYLLYTHSLKYAKQSSMENIQEIYFFSHDENLTAGSQETTDGTQQHAAAGSFLIILIIIIIIIIILQCVKETFGDPEG